MRSDIAQAKIQQIKQLSAQHLDRRQIQLPFSGLDAAGQQVFYSDQLTFYYGKLESTETLGVELEHLNE